MDKYLIEIQELEHKYYMTKTEGWGLFARDLRKMVDLNTIQLKNVDPKDTIRIAQLQQKIKDFEGILSRMEIRLPERLAELTNAESLEAEIMKGKIF